MVALLCVVAALGALGLIGLQLFVVHAICGWCMAVDGAAIVAALCALALLRLPPDREGRGLRYAWGGVGGAAVAVPLIWANASSGGQVPPGVLALQRPERIDVINFTDFECPFCRKLHSVLEQLVAAHPDQLRVVRLMVPLAYHRGAKPAALGYLCAPESSRQPLAERLYGAAPGELTLSTVAKLAVQLGLEAEPFVSCLTAPATRARLGALGVEHVDGNGRTGHAGTAGRAHRAVQTDRAHRHPRHDCGRTAHRWRRSGGRAHRRGTRCKGRQPDRSALDVRRSRVARHGRGGGQPLGCASPSQCRALTASRGLSPCLPVTTL